MSLEELTERFPEIPRDLREEPVLARFAEVFDDLLRAARRPSPCSTRYDAANHYYLKLVGPLSIYGYGLASRDRVLDGIRRLVEGRRADPRGFPATLIPRDAVDTESRGPGCSD